MNARAISIGTTFNHDIPLHEQSHLIRQAGFTHISLAGGNLLHSNYLAVEGQRNIRRIVEDAGLGICSIHAPFFRQDADISSCDKKEAARSLEVFKRCVDAAVYLKAGVVVIHPCPMQFDMPEARKTVLVSQIRSLIEYIGTRRVKIAVENLPSTVVNGIMDHSLAEINDEHYGFCYDSSHDYLMHNPLEILKKHGHRLLTTHISDNRGEKDDHLLPFEGTFPWADFIPSFRRTGFQGIFLLEVEMRESSFKIPGEFLAAAYARGIGLMPGSAEE